MFDLKNYEPVENRIRSFYDKYESGRIITELIAYSDNQFIVKASVYRNDTDQVPATTGYAEERVGSSPVNRTSALENCETSAIGRALANLNFAPKGARPSQEEMNKASRYEVQNGEVPREDWKSTAQGSWSEVGLITAKQVEYVDGILREACANTGFEYADTFFNHLSNWLKLKTAIKEVNDLTKKDASAIINDKRSATNQQSKLVQYLLSKQDPAIDPWATPTKG